MARRRCRAIQDNHAPYLKSTLPPRRIILKKYLGSFPLSLSPSLLSRGVSSVSLKFLARFSYRARPIGLTLASRIPRLLRRRSRAAPGVVYGRSPSTYPWHLQTCSSHQDASFPLCFRLYRRRIVAGQASVHRYGGVSAFLPATCLARGIWPPPVGPRVGPVPSSSPPPPRAGSKRALSTSSTPSSAILFLRLLPFRWPLVIRRRLGTPSLFANVSGVLLNQTVPTFAACTPVYRSADRPTILETVAENARIISSMETRAIRCAIRCSLFCCLFFFFFLSLSSFSLSLGLSSSQRASSDRRRTFPIGIRRRSVPFNKR